MQCINKKCGNPEVSYIGMEAVSVKGIFRKVIKYHCLKCRQNFSVAGGIVSKSDWKKKLKEQKENFNNLKEIN
jgi:transposase-like protein